MTLRTTVTGAAGDPATAGWARGPAHAWRAVSARTGGPAATAVERLVAELTSGLAGRPAAAVVWFASDAYEPLELAGPLAAAFPDATVIGCSTAGEFTDQGTGTGTIVALALPRGPVVRAAAALGHLADPARGTAAAVAELEAETGTRLADLDPARHVAVLLVDGMRSAEEAVSAALHAAAPRLGVVGGSAGDDLAFQRTWVAVGERISFRGAAVLVLELGVPFRLVRTCSFTPTGSRLRVTRADPAARTVLEFDGLPAVQAYAAALGLRPERLTGAAFLRHPLGLMVDGEPWIRSPNAVTAEGGMAFFAQLPEGLEMEVLMAGDLLVDTAATVRRAVRDLGGVSGALMFNSVLRRLELDHAGTHEPFVGVFAGIPTAGFHTYGEILHGHVNQTLTGLVLG